VILLRFRNYGGSAASEAAGNVASGEGNVEDQEEKVERGPRPFLTTTGGIPSGPLAEFLRESRAVRSSIMEILRESSGLEGSGGSSVSAKAVFSEE
jgi:hypothetical protein